MGCVELHGNRRGGGEAIAKGVLVFRVGVGGGGRESTFKTQPTRSLHRKSSSNRIGDSQN